MINHMISCVLSLDAKTALPADSRGNKNVPVPPTTKLKAEAHSSINVV